MHTHSPTREHKTSPLRLASVRVSASIAKPAGSTIDEADTMKEEWKPFGDGNYAVSNLGRVKRLTEGRRTYPGRLMKLVKLKIGYYSVAPTVNGKNKTVLVHSLVAEAFIGPRPEGKEVNHKDGDKTNNCVENLEYVSHKQNVHHARDMGLIGCSQIHDELKVSRIRHDRLNGLSFRELSKKYDCGVGFAYQSCKGTAPALNGDDITTRSKFSPRLTDSDVVQMRILRHSGALISTVASEFGVSETHAAYICNGDKRANAGGPITEKRERNMS